MGADVDGGKPKGDTPLVIAIVQDNLAVKQCLVINLGADINQVMQPDERTPLIIAAREGNLAVVRCLFELSVELELSAELELVDTDGNTALFESALSGHFRTTQHLLEEAGASMEVVSYDDQTIWDPLIVEYSDEEEEDPAALPKLLRVMVLLRDVPPPALVALLSPELARVVQEGTWLLARLLVYLAHRRAYLDARCPRISFLPDVLRTLIYTFEGPPTAEEVWATGQGTAP
jgi:hypothetical protein